MRDQAATSVHANAWQGYLAADFPFADFEPGARVLDVGFGGGRQLNRLRALGCLGFGIETDSALAERAAARGLTVCRAKAEHLPFGTASFDGLICKVVIPYTDEALAVVEIGRVLRPGGIARLAYHGLGYPLRYITTARNWKRRAYGARMILNTWVYAVSGARLPGFWGDTLYQSNSRIGGYYYRAGLELMEERPPARFMGAAVFLYHVVRRRRDRQV